jgi:hypothetical protein
MGTQTTDLDQMMRTLAEASKDPNAVTVGEFAKAIEYLQAELRMLESEVDKLGGTIGKAFDVEPAEEASAATKSEATGEAAPVQIDA